MSVINCSTVASAYLMSKFHFNLQSLTGEERRGEERRGEERRGEERRGEERR